MTTSSERGFDYTTAFSRNIGWVTEEEQLLLKAKKVAIAGMGGVGGSHLMTFARLGISHFHIADMDQFDLVNFNRQLGARMSSLGQPKVHVLADMVRDVSPDAKITCFEKGINAELIDAFLDGVDLYVDGLDFFVLDIRAQIFKACAEKGIPAITAAPLGMGTAFLTFMPGKMSFEEYFQIDGKEPLQQYVNFLFGLSPRLLQRPYLMDDRRVDLGRKKGPSTIIAVELCAGVLVGEALKVLLGRGRIWPAPYYQQYDVYRGKFVRGYMPFGNRNPLQQIKCFVGRKMAQKMSDAAEHLVDEAQKMPLETPMERVLDVARWTPSGDNSQPWRFVLKGENEAEIHVSLSGRTNVYEYNNGQPTLIAVGMLLENIDIAATIEGAEMSYYIVQQDEDRIILNVKLTVVGRGRDPLVDYIRFRKTDRRAYQPTRLPAAVKADLSATLGKHLKIDWYESIAERLKISRLSARATDIRLQIPEAFAVHEKTLDWGAGDSRSGIPVHNLGLDPLSVKIMKWSMGKWSRTTFVNRFLGGTILARLLMDMKPGLGCAAHFVVRPVKGGDLTTEDLLDAGRHLGRFWLKTSRYGLSLQPNLAPLCFGRYGEKAEAFTTADKEKSKAQTLARRFEEDLNVQPSAVLFMGRVGYAGRKPLAVRSARYDLSELVKSS